MAKLILGIAASHTTLMNTKWADVDHLERAHDFRNALGTAAQKLSAANPDLVIILGSNHFRGFWLDLMPPFTVGVGEVNSAGEHLTPNGQLHSSPEAGLAICEGLITRDFDCAFSTSLSVDHGISHAVQWLMGEVKAPIVPIVINCFAPPLPSLPRIKNLGAALREAISGLHDEMRVAVIATGGLSHALPFPDWRDPEDDDGAFLAESWRKGRGRWAEFEERRRAIIVSAPAQINEEFDRALLAAFAQGELDRFLSTFSNTDLVSNAGNGGNEVRAWLALSEIFKNQPAEVLSYSAMPEWLTGMAVALVHPAH